MQINRKHHFPSCFYGNEEVSPHMTFEATGNVPPLWAVTFPNYKVSLPCHGKITGEGRGGKKSFPKLTKKKTACHGENVFPHGTKLLLNSAISKYLDAEIFKWKCTSCVMHASTGSHKGSQPVYLLPHSKDGG